MTDVVESTTGLDVLPFSDAPDLTDDEASTAFWPPADAQSEEHAPEERLGWQLPDAIEADLIAWSDDITRAKWGIARRLADYITTLPASKVAALRPLVIKQGALFCRTEPGAIREWVHVAEIIPYPVEHTPRYGQLGFSHFARAARMGDPGQAVAVLDEAIKRAEVQTPGKPPTCAAVNELVTEFKARAEGVSEDEITRRKAALEKRAAQRFEAQVIDWQTADARGREDPALRFIVVPADKDIYPNDLVLVLLQSQGAE